MTFNEDAWAKVPITTEFDAGFVVGLLVGEGHFGGDWKQPQVVISMTDRHRQVFAWLLATFPGSRVNGPYRNAGLGKLSVYRWMARGPFLRQSLVPYLDQYMSPTRDEYSFGRYQAMKEQYGL